MIGCSKRRVSDPFAKVRGLVLRMDNFDRIFDEQWLPRSTVDGLRPLTLEMVLLVAAGQPLHELDLKRCCLRSALSRTIVVATIVWCLPTRLHSVQLRA